MQYIPRCVQNLRKYTIVKYSVYMNKNVIKLKINKENSKLVLFLVIFYSIDINVVWIIKFFFLEVDVNCN